MKYQHSGRKSFPEAVAESHHLIANLLITDLELALTFLEVAKTSQIEETVLRNRQNARKAHDSAVQMLSKHGFHPEDRRLVEKKIDIVRKELEGPDHAS